MVEKLVEQLFCLIFCIPNKILYAASLKILHTSYSQSCKSKTQTYKWYKASKEGLEFLVDLSRCGRHLTHSNDANIEKLKKAGA